MSLNQIALLSVHTSPLDQPGVGDAGGLNVYVVETAKRLAQQNIGVDIFTRRTSSSVKNESILFDGVKVKQITAGPFEGLTKQSLPSQLCALSAGVLREEALQKEGYYQLIHSHYWLSGQVGWVASERWNVPLVHSMHTMAKVKNSSLAIDDSPEPTEREIGEQQVVDAANQLVANTESEAQDLIHLYGADTNNVSVVNPGVDLDLFSPGDQLIARKELGIPQDAIVFTFVGRVQPLKAPDVLIKAAHQFINDHPNLKNRVRVVICGGLSGSGLNRPESLVSLVKELDLLENVIFLAPSSREKLTSVYRASTLVAVPSYSESFGLVAIEAQACGVPVIATNVGGLKTTVADNKSGLLVNGHDPRTWAQVLAQLSLVDAELKKLQIGARQHALNFSWDKTVSGLINVYEKALVTKPKQVKFLRAL
ncbi:MAG: D-inositol-3-phosphate glycosyltransferase [Candidatus Nanopelagicales bacterium]|jgi:D-inositol-3-phosphate glycosyltransferase|nr:D-inositol-3-phosphate glycosyltransferase [Candidatus Nanopelagicales bacterium]